MLLLDLLREVLHGAGKRNPVNVQELKFKGFWGAIPFDLKHKMASNYNLYITPSKTPIYTPRKLWASGGYITLGRFIPL